MPEAKILSPRRKCPKVLRLQVSCADSSRARSGTHHFKLLIKPGDFVPGNMYFTTTRLHQELAGATFVDVIIDEAHDSQSTHPFKGNMDLQKAGRHHQKSWREEDFVCHCRGDSEYGGGQPISMDNLRQIRALTAKYNIKVILDATRAVENAYFIKVREKGYEKKSIAEILKEMCSYSDGATMSGKKDLLVNIGGFLRSTITPCSKKRAIWLWSMRTPHVRWNGRTRYGSNGSRDRGGSSRSAYQARIARSNMSARNFKDRRSDRGADRRPCNFS